MARQISGAGLSALKQWEGKRLNAYRDEGGVLTIGYGHTSAAGEPYVKVGMTITEKEAEAILHRDMLQYRQGVEKYVKVPLADNQFAVLVSFCYNVGVDGLKGSTLLKKLNAGDYDAIPAELMKWVKVKDKKTGKKVTSKGLVNRRSAEAGLWAKGEFVTSGYVPAAPHKENALIKPETVGPVAGALAGAGSLLSGSGPIQWALAVVMLVSCLVGAWYFIQRMKREAA